MATGITPTSIGQTMAAGNDLAPRKSLGQHWLTDKDSLNSIIELADLAPTDLVVEIGPGMGALTKIMAPKVNQLIAIELDNKLASYLSNLNMPNVSVINQDVLEFNFDQIDEYKIVANIPYYLTGKIIRLISELKNRPLLVVLLVQKEIADKLSAKAGDLSILGLTAQYYWQIEAGPLVSSDKFEPPPKVDSQIVRLSPKELSLSNKQSEELFRLLKMGFSSKRKTMLNNLAAGLRQDKASISKLLNSAEINPDRRPQTLHLTEWERLLAKL